ncbi:MAG: hypothetical protein AB7W16_01690 [Candidatus Obscuribacterales bacterium]
MTQMRILCTGVLAAGILALSAQLCLAEDSKQPETEASTAGRQSASDFVKVDEEVRSPEGSCFACCTIYEKSGDQFKSTQKSVPASLIEQIHKV